MNEHTEAILKEVLELFEFMAAMSYVENHEGEPEHPTKVALDGTEAAMEIFAAVMKEHGTDSMQIMYTLAAMMAGFASQYPDQLAKHLQEEKAANGLAWQIMQAHLGAMKEVMK